MRRHLVNGGQDWFAIVERQSIVTSSSFSGAREKQMASTFDISDSDEFSARPRAAESSLISTEDEIGTAVCWSAIIAGALAATAVTMILLVLGVGAGLFHHAWAAIWPGGCESNGSVCIPRKCSSATRLTDSRVGACGGNRGHY